MCFVRSLTEQTGIHVCQIPDTNNRLAIGLHARRKLLRFSRIKALFCKQTRKAAEKFPLRNGNEQHKLVRVTVFRQSCREYLDRKQGQLHEGVSTNKPKYDIANDGTKDKYKIELGRCVSSSVYRVRGKATSIKHKVGQFLVFSFVGLKFKICVGTKKLRRITKPFDLESNADFVQIQINVKWE